MSATDPTRTSSILVLGSAPSSLSRVFRHRGDVAQGNFVRAAQDRFTFDRDISLKTRRVGSGLPAKQRAPVRYGQIPGAAGDGAMLCHHH